ncbi:CDP-glycerol glycerophosphotransferase family protein [Silanimonas sp.]|jgi:CDP-glycerol glycerophosphotransferase (TagB/SpsB family)|uniref:CDP-glycerol glycerophosphotransferase family protein n=1 Tax=Silanimonas sp. TaxID=1929290 RepID=UPI0022BF57C1|nr:CDP-glycerol glycerophosphotransferase family protein [Silanimonas sp.]MCZ8167490.1 CDP-glycerol glycerophosphotransferase family protein [Silanimonas sp.]
MRRLLRVSLRLLGIVPLWIVWLVISCVPRRRELWLFGAWNGRKFIDNPKYIYREALTRHPEIQAMWVAKDQRLFEDMRRRGLPVVLARSPRGVWAQLRAGAVIFTHSAEWDFDALWLGWPVRRIQTWHGMPIKRIGYDNDKDWQPQLRARITTLLWPYRNDRAHLILAAADVDAVTYRRAFNVEPQDVVLTGYPRNDLLAASRSLTSRRDRLRVIYMPTLRGTPGSAFPLLSEGGFDFQTVDLELARLGIDLFIKAHPVQRFCEADEGHFAAARHIYRHTGESDIYEELGDFDALITDYSGIYFDFLLTERPIIMAPFDLNQYLSSDRGLYFQYDDICPDSPCVDWKTVLQRLASLREKIGKPPHERYRALLNRFHRYTDDGSSARAISAIKLRVGLQ